MKIDFHNLSEEELFRARLKGEHIDFGFIPKWDRKRFVKICRDTGILERRFRDRGFDKYESTVEITFQTTRSVLEGLPFLGALEWLADLFGHRRRQVLSNFFLVAVEDAYIIPVKKVEKRTSIHSRVYGTLVTIDESGDIDEITGIRNFGYH